MTGFIGTTQSAESSQWIRGLPTGWRYSRLKWTITSAKNGVWGDEADGGIDDIPCVRVADFDRDRLQVVDEIPTLRSVEGSQRRGRVLAAGDLLLEKSGGGEKQPVGAVVLYGHSSPAVCSNFVARLVPSQDNHGRFLVYLHASLYFQRVNLRSIKQTTGIQNLDEQMYLDEVVALPPKPIQESISDFLDRKTAAIDILISKKERLISLLAEKRAALIHCAVTKGLNHDAQMRDSGIPWMGHIPAHWKIHQLRRVVSEFVDYRGRTPDKSTSGVPLITAGAVRDGRIDHNRAPEWVSEETYEILSQRGGPKVGDLLFTSEAPLGEVGLVVDPRIACAQRIILFRVNKDKMSPEYLRLHFLAETGKGEMRSRASGSTAEGIRADRLKMSLVPTPPLNEQKDICAYVETKTRGFDIVSERVQVQLDRFREYRQALITAAVTGQLDIGASSP